MSRGLLILATEALYPPPNQLFCPLLARSFSAFLRAPFFPSLQRPRVLPPLFREHPFSASSAYSPGRTSPSSQFACFPLKPSTSCRLLSSLLSPVFLLSGVLGGRSSRLFSLPLQLGLSRNRSHLVLQFSDTFFTPRLVAIRRNRFLGTFRALKRKLREI